jgi:hypothetical protein
MEEAPPASIIQALDFGGLLLNEVQGRSDSLDSKAINIIGWSGILLAFLVTAYSSFLVGNTRPGLIVLAILGVATIAATSAIGYAALALWIRDWRWPSERDWFKQELFSRPEWLAEYYLECMLEAHKVHNEACANKGDRLHHAQWLLALAGLLVGLVLLGRILEALIRAVL